MLVHRVHSVGRMEPITKVMCAVDLSHRSDATIRAAGTIARELGALLDIVYVYEFPAFAALERASSGSDEHAASALERARACLAEHQRIQERLGTRVTCHLLEGSPAKALEHHIASSRPGLLVFGIRARKGIKDFYFSTVAEQVASVSDVPMIPVDLRGEHEATKP
ncbi:MAG: universal stress protein [Myxococcales bacterium]